MQLPAYKVLRNKTEMRAFMDRIYPNGKPKPGWESVAIDTEFCVEEAPPNVVGNGGAVTHLAYVQLSQGTERVVIEGPLVSRAKGKDLNLPRMLRPWLTDPKVKKRLSTTRADFRVLKDTGIGTMRGIECDTEVMDWLYDENRMFHGLKDSAYDHCGIRMQEYGKTFSYHPLNKNGTRSKRTVVASMRQVVEGSEAGHEVPWSGAEGRKRAEEYAALDPYATFKLSDFHRTQLKKQKLWEWYREVERPLTMTLIRMEDRGIRINVNRVDEIRKEVYADILRVEHVVRAATDEPKLNLRSNKQMQEVLFGKLKWPVLERNDLTESQEEAGQEEGNASLAASVLDQYEQKGYGLATHLKAHRSKNTLHNVFLVGLLEKRDPATGLVHTIFKQARTVTGRLSSGDRKMRKMNLQNIPAKKEKDPYRLRQFFLPTHDNHALVVADYAQIELYILAQMSGDKRMIQAYQRGEDLHMLTASKIYNLKLPKEPAVWDVNHPDFKRWVAECDAWKEKWKDERGDAKTVNFGINYGMSPFKLSIDFDMDIEEAEEWVEKYFELYPGVKKFQEDSIEMCEEFGFVTTISGRPRRIPEIDSTDKKIRGHAERQAMNARIQGSVADIIKVAMNALEYGSRYKCRYAPVHVCEKAQEAKELGYVQLLQVHDELVGQSPKKHSSRSAELVKEVMEGVFPDAFDKVRIKAGVGVGLNWNDAKK